MTTTFWDSSNRAELEERNRQAVAQVVDKHRDVMKLQSELDLARADLALRERMVSIRRTEADVMESTLDYLASEFHLLPDGCPEPWFSILQAFGDTAEGALRGEESNEEEPEQETPQTTVGAPPAEATTPTPAVERVAERPKRGRPKKTS